MVHRVKPLSAPSISSAEVYVVNKVAARELPSGCRGNRQNRQWSGQNLVVAEAAQQGGAGDWQLGTVPQSPPTSRASPAAK